MEINSKDELLSVIEDLQSRLAVVEDRSSKKEADTEEESSEENQEESSEKTKEVESEDEIEKLLNV